MPAPQIGTGEVLRSERGGLYTGDYSIKGLERFVAIERKSLDDLMGCLGFGRALASEPCEEGRPVQAGRANSGIRNLLFQEGFVWLTVLKNAYV